jgi:hypothetical protein
MRVLVVTNLTPDAAAPGRGAFVRDQVRWLERAGVKVELFSFPVGRSISREKPVWRRLIAA